MIAESGATDWKLVGDLAGTIPEVENSCNGRRGRKQNWSPKFTPKSQALWDQGFK